jgi:hypothetical protein
LDDVDNEEAGDEGVDCAEGNCDLDDECDSVDNEEVGDESQQTPTQRAEDYLPELSRYFEKIQKDQNKFEQLWQSMRGSDFPSTLALL